MPHPLPPSPRLRFAAVLAAAVLPLGATALGSPAAALGRPAPAPISHPDADHLGSTLRGRAHDRAAAPTAPTGTSTATATPALAAALPAGARPLGVDVASYEGSVDWAAAAAKGASFAYVKATEGVTYQSPTFSQQYNGSASAGLIRGAYHFALPDRSGGKAQADFFVDHGGTWTADGRTLPPLLDIEYNPYGPTCFGLSQAAMTAWIADFGNEVKARTGRTPSLYTTTDWWTTCTGNSPSAAADPLFVANYNGSPAPLPAGWTGQHIWQYADSGVLPGDQDVFNGTAADLAAFAAGTGGTPAAPPALSWPTVQQGQTGYRVSMVQHLLNAHGASLTVDGDFGPGTRSAVVSFQSAQGLSADGVVGPRTWQALVSTVGEGASGSTVKAAQTGLDAHGASLTVDGGFGPATRDAVVSYQVAQGLPADATVQKPTWLALVA
ncbi:peptidoglycan-binding protein [Streptacidiphilus sp. ASG 303]|uniref:GH25 family lysozyme n=1 Tax=Streptacidiphilus sp. ASG 303 TaxID=2896847 RepID=UPI001E2D978B|nr:GH25 family lysozyme [Streptacidiphilus sp. ASG 303]MCD0481047.1 peptidoglycan-binding protein [Streptacidiphilus sp. ASG 303]